MRSANKFSFDSHSLLKFKTKSRFAVAYFLAYVHLLYVVRDESCVINTGTQHSGEMLEMAAGESGEFRVKGGINKTK